MDNPNILYNHITTFNTIILILFILFNYKFTLYYIYLFLNLSHQGLYTTPRVVNLSFSNEITKLVFLRFLLLSNLSTAKFFFDN